MRPRAVVSWSGGKDSCLALMRACETCDVAAILTVFDEAGARTRSHGLRPEVIVAQADRLGCESIVAWAAWATYTERFEEALVPLARRGITHVVFGDIFDDSHREWCERVASGAGLTAVLPLWGESTSRLTREFLDRGGEARFVTVRCPPLDPDLLGSVLTPETVDDFERRGVDPGGERGEYHTVVTSSPLFSSPLELRSGRRVRTGDCWAVDLAVPERAAGADATAASR